MHNFCLETSLLLGAWSVLNNELNLSYTLTLWNMTASLPEEWLYFPFWTALQDSDFLHLFVTGCNFQTVIIASDRKQITIALSSSGYLC